MLVLILSHVCEKWTDKKKTNMGDIKFLRRGANGTFTDEIRHNSIIINLQILNTDDNIADRKRKWEEHPVGMNSWRTDRNAVPVRPKGV
jgi:hypothetical protein